MTYQRRTSPVKYTVALADFFVPLYENAIKLRSAPSPTHSLDFKDFTILAVPPSLRRVTSEQIFSLGAYFASCGATAEEIAEGITFERVEQKV